MSELEQIRVLLVEDDEDDYILTRGLFTEMKGRRFQVDWFKSYALGLEAMPRNQHDVCLIDYRLGAKNGIELMQEALARGCQAPIILLTGLGEHAVDLEAMKAGAADYLVKSQLRADSLERSIRYALERKRAAAIAAFEQANLAAFGADIGLSLTQRDSLSGVLYRCADAMVRYLNAHLAQIWILNPEDNMLHLRASAGAINDIANGGGPLTKLAPTKEITGDGKPLLVNKVAGAACIPCPEWVEEEGIVAYAGYPMMLENRLIGLLSIFSHDHLSQPVIQALSSVSYGIALTVENKRSEEALDASEIKYRSVVESLKEVVFQVNEFGDWTSLNPAWTEITGFEVKEVLGSLFLEYIHHDERQRNSHIFLQLMERKIDYCRYETRLLTKDGKTRWVDVYAQLTVNADGSILGASGSLTDITDRKHAEKQIQKLAAFPQVNPNPVLEFDANGTLTYFNDAARALAKQLKFALPEEILPEKASELAREALSSHKKLSTDVARNGRTISWSFFPIPTSQVVHCYGVDITDMQNLEAQFRQAQKMESVGQLAAGVAHDFNNILTVIQGYSDYLLARCDGDEAITNPLKQVSDASRRAAALTRQLLMFSRKQVLQPKTIDLNAVLRNVSNMLTRLLGEQVKVNANYAAELPALEADTGMLEQVVMNLAVNARDAMPKGGQLTISTSVQEIDEAYVRQHPDSRVGTTVCLEVTDTGCGMDAKTLDRIFEPFFSTKEVGKGTGLGLATVYGIVKQHQGWIEVKSTVGVGTTFKIYLPASGKKVVSSGDSNSQEPAKIAKGRNETILLVEDETILRLWVKEILENCDYRIVEASNGAEALKVYDAQNGKIDLLLTDMVMPEGMTGGDLARQLKTRQPKLKVIYTSGYSAEIMGNDKGLPDGPFLSKPYPAPQLAKMVREALDAA
ncbi:MAG TPA: response regulator [Verrucomicrobiae bacterium]|nr:response regulator [Verrucomicrobiae bacterium]